MTPTPETLRKAVDDFGRCPFCKGWDFVDGQRKHSEDCVGAQSADLWAASEQARQTAETDLTMEATLLLNSERGVDPLAYRLLDICNGLMGRAALAPVPLSVNILRTGVCPECEGIITSGINRCPHCSGE